MSSFAKVVLVLLGLAALLPGLCYLGFGLLFAQASRTPGSVFGGFTKDAPGHLLLGGVLIVLAITIFVVVAKTGDKPPPR